MDNVPDLVLQADSSQHTSVIEALKGKSLVIQGPPGTGKTTLIKEGVSKILNRPFAFLALGGATDSSFLEGHSYTYEGSTWGKIVDILLNSKCMNPVFYFDELDKISKTPKGKEITGILTHLTDTTQNDKYHDKYNRKIKSRQIVCNYMGKKNIVLSSTEYIIAVGLIQYTYIEAMDKVNMICFALVLNMYIVINYD